MSDPIATRHGISALVSLHLDHCEDEHWISTPTVLCPFRAFGRQCVEADDHTLKIAVA